jgi:tetratricopeptide (TPR) repeat protein
LKVSTDDLAEPYARLHLGRKDERGALPYLEQALAADDKRQDLWLLQGQTADHLHNAHLAMKSFEQGLALGGVHVADACTLLRLYVNGKETAKAHALAQHTVETLPADGAARVQFAECVDDAKLPAESLAAWKSVLAVEPDSERGHVRVAQLLLETGDVKAAEEAARSSLQTLPKSGALFLAKADAILQEGRIYEARATLEEGAAGTQDPAVLAKLAAAQEVYGDRAPEAYFHLAGVLDKGSPERIHALDRGFGLSLRDNDLKQAATFAGLLDAEGHPEYRVLLGEKREVHNDAVVPGGLDALSVIANVKQGTPPERFLAEFANQVVSNVCANYCAGDRYSTLVQSYFTTIADLERMGKRDGNRVSVVLSLNGKDERNHAQDVLKLLGLQMHTEKGQIRLDRGEKQSQNKKQDILAALAIDEVGLEEALQSGKSFTFEILDEFAEVYPSARMWKDSFPKLDQSQFALMLLRNPLMARLYVGISRLDRRTLQALIGNSGLFVFVGRPADSLLQYGASFALEADHAAVPGGAAAGPIWSQLAGASTDRPGAFYHALLDQKSPGLLAYFYALSNLDQRHQAFFTANLARTKRFYDLFATLPESQAFSSNEDRETAFKELLRSVPLDDDGHVAFPGSPEVWTVAKGSASDDRHVAKMMKKVSRAATPEVEDEVLLHLLETRYKSHSVMNSELDNFLAIAGIDAHRATPLDEESALMLAQHYSDFSAAYPYFAELSAIDAAGFRSFFSLVDGVARQPLLERQLEMGQLNSLIEWVVLIRRRRVIDDAEAARLFAQICDRLAAANDEGARSLASIDLAQGIITDCGHGAAGRWDDILRTCLVGGSADRSAAREKDYGVILDEQKAPSIDAVRAIVVAANTALTPAGAAHTAVIAPDKAALPAAPLPAGVKVTGKEKEAVLLYDPARAQKLIEEWNQNAARSHQDQKTAQSAQKLAGELLGEMEPQVTLALAAPVYAYFFRSTDRVVAEDPLLLRKHRYFNFVLDGSAHSLVSESAFMATSDGLGSYFEGGFAQFGQASGLAAAAGWKQGGSGGSTAVAEEIAAIRSATWDQLVEADQRLVTLRILAAREWIVAAAQDAKLFTALSEETSGLLSLSRRADLLNGIEERDWAKAWSSITLPDLFRLGGNYLRRFPSGPSASPVVAQLRLAEASNQGARLDILGGIPSHVLGCSHTHLVSDAPYEEYERLLIPTYLAERTAEFKLFLAYRADSVGVQPADLPSVAERLAAKAFSSSQMTDYHDWRSLLSAYASITNDNLKSALEQ